MLYYFENADHLKAAIALVAGELGITLADTPDAAEIIVTVAEAEEPGLTAVKNGNTASIRYGGGTVRFLRALAHLASWIKEDVNDRTVTEHPLFHTNGAMIDMSRNAVMNPDTVKFMFRKMALMGLNTFMLYTEDTYELPGHPYFGYMRGRYTLDEIRELDQYALTLGIELIPCIQTLGHLATHLRWRAALPYKDTQRVMLAGADATNQIIRDMLRTVSKVFTSRRVHVGLDETHDLGAGRYLDINGYRDRSEIYMEHLHTVAKMAEEEGLKPMMWSDMFFRLHGKGLRNFIEYDPRIVLPENLREQLPENMTPVFWDYYNDNEEFYSVNIDKHREFADKMLFAGGVWGWSGPTFLFSRSRRFTIPALEACKKKGVKQVIATVWGNGSESDLILSLAGLAWYADYDYTGSFDEASIARCFDHATGESYEAFLLTEKPEGLNESKYLPLTRSLLYNDPMTGLVDAHMKGLDCGAYYRGVSALLADVKPADPRFEPAFDSIRKLTSLLENKADFGLRLKAAYDAGDREALAALAGECDTVIEKVDALIMARRTAWMTYNKPFGWEVHDIRYGGIRSRFVTAKERIVAYLDGRIDRIEELEAERLRIDCTSDDANRFNGFLWNGYQTIATANLL